MQLGYFCKAIRAQMQNQITIQEFGVGPCLGQGSPTCMQKETQPQTSSTTFIVADDSRWYLICNNFGKYNFMDMKMEKQTKH